MSTCLQLPLPPTHTPCKLPLKTRRLTIPLTPNAAKFPFLHKLSAVHSHSTETPTIFSSVGSPPKPKPSPPDPSPTPSPSSPPPAEVQPSRYGKLRRRPPNFASLALHSRIVHINGELNSRVAELVIQQLMFLQYMDAKRPIYLHIDSPGVSPSSGEVADGFIIYDFMKMMKCEIYTLNTGQADCMACLLLAAGTKGKRYSKPNATALLAPLFVNHTGLLQASDLAIHSSAAMKDRATYVKLLAKCTGTSEETIYSKMEEQYKMNADMAIEFGVVDKILSPSDPPLMRKLPPSYYKKKGRKRR